MEISMKRSFGLKLGSASLLLAVTCVAVQQFAVADSSTAVSDKEASMFYGGACEGGKAYTTDGKCGTQYVGCFAETNHKTDDTAGSYTATTQNCGVSECGTYTKITRCSN